MAAREIYACGLIAGLDYRGMPGMLIGEILDMYMVRRDYDMAMHQLTEQHGGG